MAKKENAYSVKLKLIPKDKKFKSAFIQGIVFGANPKIVQKNAIETFVEAFKKDTREIVVKPHSISKLRKDFILYPKVNKE